MMTKPKLTAAMQVVVDRLARGGVLFYSRGAKGYKMRDRIEGGFDNTTTLSKYMVDKLKDHKVIERNGFTVEGSAYRLSPLGRELAKAEGA